MTIPEFAGEIKKANKRYEMEYLPDLDEIDRITYTSKGEERDLYQYRSFILYLAIKKEKDNPLTGDRLDSKEILSNLALELFEIDKADKAKALEMIKDLSGAPVEAM